MYKPVVLTTLDGDERTTLAFIQDGRDGPFATLIDGGGDFDGLTRPVWKLEVKVMLPGALVRSVNHGRARDHPLHDSLCNQL